VPGEMPGPQKTCEKFFQKGEFHRCSPNGLRQETSWQAQPT
jgi:hypothetical protein